MLLVAFALLGAGMYLGLWLAETLARYQHDRDLEARWLARHRHPSGRQWR
jgi:hypothetical protein